MTQTVDTLPSLRIERTLAAPRALVWRAWTDPAAIAIWWGPKGFSAPRCEFDARPGGMIRIDMMQADGTIYPMDGEVEAIDPPERLVFMSGALNAAGERLFDTRSILKLEEDGDRTRLTLDVSVTAIHDPLAVNHLAGMEIGWNQSLDCLAEACASDLLGDLERR